MIGSVEELQRRAVDAEGKPLQPPQRLHDIHREHIDGLRVRVRWGSDAAGSTRCSCCPQPDRKRHAAGRGRQQDEQAREQNYPAPDKILDDYGADALRISLCSSPVMHAEKLKFSEADVL